MIRPYVCAVMLTADRHALAARAIDAFTRQTYQNASLLIYDTGIDPLAQITKLGIWHYRINHSKPATVGEMRNRANALSAYANHLTHKTPDIICHWDDDDWSHPMRIEEQVEALEGDGVAATGYRTMLFWRERRRLDIDEIPGSWLNDGADPLSCYQDGQAWLYSNYRKSFAVGTSLCYWRREWQKRPFEALPVRKGRDGGQGEDSKWVIDLSQQADGVSGRPCFNRVAEEQSPFNRPRMVARIHAGNTSYYGDDLLKASSSWERVPQWDEFCKTVMED